MEISWSKVFENDYPFTIVTTELNSIAVDSAGTCYIAGNSYGKRVVVKDNATSIITDSTSGYVLCKLDNNGNYKWSVGSKFPTYGRVHLCCS
jgi:hypothetical protein